MSLAATLGIRVPVLQGGMTFGSDGRLVAAVARAGGLGTLGTFHYRTHAELDAELALIRAQAPGLPFAVNVPFFENSIELVRHLVAGGVRTLALGGWCTDEVAALREQHDLTVLVSVNGPTVARMVAGQPFDAWIAQGNESGGANSHFTRRQLFDYLAETDPRPVVLAGGLWDGHDLHSALALGAAGIQLGTRFLFCDESPLHASIKQRVVEHGAKRPTTTQLVPVTDSLSMRFIQNKPLKQALRTGEIERIFTDKQRVFDLSAAFWEDQGKSVLMYAGAGIGRLRAVQSVAEVIDEIVAEYETLRTRPLPALGG